MTFRDMTSQEMLATTRTWVNTDHPAHKALMARPLTAAMMPEVAGAHEGLEQAVHPNLSSVLTELARQSLIKDDLHDNLIRCLDARLLSEILRAPSNAAAAPFIRLRTLFMPEGVSLVQKSYAHEVTHAREVAEKLTAEQRAFLQTIPMVEGTLDDVVTDYLATAEQLGELERQRREMDDARPDRGNVLHARNQWIRAVALVMTAADVLGTEHSEIHELALAVKQAKKAEPKTKP